MVTKVLFSLYLALTQLSTGFRLSVAFGLAEVHPSVHSIAEKYKNQELLKKTQDWVSQIDQISLVHHQMTLHTWLSSTATWDTIPDNFQKIDTKRRSFHPKHQCCKSTKKGKVQTKCKWSFKRSLFWPQCTLKLTKQSLVYYYSLQWTKLHTIV